MKQVVILGSTGSIGVNTLDVISYSPEKFSVFALSAHQQVERLYEQCIRHKPRYAVMLDEKAAVLLRDRLAAEGSTVAVLSGSHALEEIAAAPEVHIVMAAIVGAAGLLPTLAAARAGKRILLANKEALVMAGDLFMKTVQTHQAMLLPVDSEHNAIFQCLSGRSEHVSSIILTASGGPFLNTPVSALSSMTPEQAVAHPNWRMGAKISVDSATMMNKGLEVIEATYLFNRCPQVLIHPQSIIHSMVQYIDGSTLAQLGNPDMRTPIAHALAWPERINSGVEPLNLAQVSQLNFFECETERFPCLKLAYQALQAGGTALPILNAANEVAVDAFLAGKILFTQIAELVEGVLAASSFCAADTIEQVVESDKQARVQGGYWIDSFS